MSEVKIKTRLVGKFDGVNGTPAGVITLKFKLAYDELVNYIKITQFLNNVIDIKINDPAEMELEAGDKAKAFDVGKFNVKSLNIEGDGEAKLVFTSIAQAVDMEEISKLLLFDRGTNLIINLEADVELEDEDDDEPVDNAEEKSAEDKASNESMNPPQMHVDSWSEEQGWPDDDSWDDSAEENNDGWD